MPDPHASMTFDSFTRAAPAVYAALRALGNAVDDSGLVKPLTELVKVRVSQLNGCAFCLQFHLDLARRHGVETRKLDLVAVWREAGVHCAREQAALGWAEALTVLGASAGAEHARQQALARVREHFSESEIPYLAASIAAIQAWNRIAAGLQFPPPPAQAAGGAA
ncbi:carboxymuconolactone decarboxylase family protein [Cupriavidus taiwanensis]|uniref:carboxymuconolactone decarboxylase family protein n=1 Tax=Cupriavidus taiwanensis TaxID=164546 RepID=UPI000E1A243B|nr:carboxymuconolactone decarboxylase family protein [Cupriavidus taiwanensis]SOZ27953.1 putative enzyme [Cupriavidus taiwanensis]SPA32178.1 putative enzyme [Cupriavidus taiwanensis]